MLIITLTIALTKSSLSLHQQYWDPETIKIYPSLILSFTPIVLTDLGRFDTHATLPLTDLGD